MPKQLSTGEGLAAARASAEPWHVRTHAANARMATVFGPIFKRAPKSEGGRWYTDPATAHIIAAAPELLEALKMARECIAYCRRAHKDAQSGSGFPVEIFLDAAIAKATGATT